MKRSSGSRLASVLDELDDRRCGRRATANSPPASIGGSCFGSPTRITLASARWASLDEVGHQARCRASRPRRSRGRRRPASRRRPDSRSAVQRVGGRWRGCPAPDCELSCGSGGEADADDAVARCLEGFADGVERERLAGAGTTDDDVDGSAVEAQLLDHSPLLGAERWAGVDGGVAPRCASAVGVASRSPAREGEDPRSAARISGVVQRPSPSWMACAESR